VPYSAQLNNTIELAHVNGEATVEILEPDGQKYVVDFSEMVAKNTSSRGLLPDFVASFFPTKNGQMKRLIRKLTGSPTTSPGIAFGWLQSQISNWIKTFETTFDCYSLAWK
jgi:hypothetical protein